MTNEEIIYQLSLFLRNETLEECPISIVSREDIEDEEAELVWFQFGTCENDMCPAIVWNSGEVFTPTSWQVCWKEYYKDHDLNIAEERWMDCNFTECIMFNGMPRKLF